MPMEQENAPKGLKGLFEVIKASCSAVVNAAAMLLENETLNRLNANQLAGLSKLLENSVERLNNTVSRLQEEIQARQVKQEEKAAAEQPRVEPPAEQQTEEETVIYAGEASEQAVKQAEREAAQTVKQSENKTVPPVEKQPGNAVDKENITDTDKQADETIPSEIAEMLNKSLSQMSEPGRLNDFLETAASFPRYSVNNIMLIASQKPDATMLMGFKSWKNKHDISVNRGEKGIRIMVPSVRRIKEKRQKLDPQSGQPMADSSGKPIMEEVEIKKPIFKAVSLFDISQTNGREKVVPEINRFRVKQNDADKINRLKSSILAAAKQELNKRGSTGKEAEAVAYAVCRRYGINTQEYRIDGLAGQNEQELRKSLELIRDVTSELTQRLDEQLKKREQEQERQKADERAQTQERERIEREKLDEKELQKKEQITDAVVASAFAAALDVNVNQGDEKQQDRTWDNGAETVGEKISEKLVSGNTPSIPHSEGSQKSKGGAPKRNTAARSTESVNRSNSSRSERREGAYRVSEKDLGQRSSVRNRLKNNINRVNAEKQAQGQREQRQRKSGEIDIG